MSHNGGNMVEDLVEFIKELLLILSLPVSIDIMKDILERSLGHWYTDRIDILK